MSGKFKGYLRWQTTLKAAYFFRPRSIIPYLEVSSGPEGNRTPIHSMPWSCSTTILRALLKILNYFRYDLGFMNAPDFLISKCKWVPVLLPVEPILPKTCPWLTCWPTLTSILCM